MNYIRQLSAVFEKFDREGAITPFHISLYMALFRQWNLNYFRNPLSISRDEMMRLSKVGSVNTYLKCLKELDTMGFITYKPSFNPQRGSLIYLFSFDTGDEQVVRPSINQLNSKKEEISDEPITHQEDLSQESRKSDRTNSQKPQRGYGAGIPPSEEEVGKYFEEKGYPPIEAHKFCNYFQSNGWLVGGRSKMKDWKAAARNWMLTSQKFDHHGTYLHPIGGNRKSGNLPVKTDKEYSEPL